MYFSYLQGRERRGRRNRRFLRHGLTTCQQGLHDMRSLQQKVLNHPAPRIPSCFSRELAAVVAKMLTKDPNQRPTVAQIRAMPEVKPRVGHL